MERTVERFEQVPVTKYVEYPVEKVVEEIVHVPITVDRVVEKRVQVPYERIVNVCINIYCCVSFYS